MILSYLQSVQDSATLIRCQYVTVTPNASPTPEMTSPPLTAPFVPGSYQIVHIYTDETDGGGGGGGESAVIEYEMTCSSDVFVGACVYVSGPGVGVVPAVSLADPSNPAKMPAVGVVVSKASPTTGVVRTVGAVARPGGVTPNAVYIVGPDSRLLDSASLPVSPRPYVVQWMGQGLSSGLVELVPAKQLTHVS